MSDAVHVYRIKSQNSFLKQNNYYISNMRKLQNGALFIVLPYTSISYRQNDLHHIDTFYCSKVKVFILCNHLTRD